MDAGNAGRTSEWVNCVVAVLTMVLTFSVQELQEALRYCSAIIQRRSTSATPAPDFRLPTSSSSSSRVLNPEKSGAEADDAAPIEGATFSDPWHVDEGSTAPSWCKCGRKCTACGIRWCGRRKVHAYSDRCHCYVCRKESKRGKLSPREIR